MRPHYALVIIIVTLCLFAKSMQTPATVDAANLLGRFVAHLPRLLQHV